MPINTRFYSCGIMKEDSNNLTLERKIAVVLFRSWFSVNSNNKSYKICGTLLQSEFLVHGWHFNVVKSLSLKACCKFLLH